VFGLVVAGLLGVLIEALIYRPIARHTLNRGANPLIPTFIASLGLSTLASNLISIHFNTTPQALDIVTLRPLRIGNVHQTNFAVVEVVVSWVLVIALFLFLRYTQRGQWITAVRSSQELAATVGINVGRIFLLVFAIGSVISGVLGLMVANATFASPTMGFDQVFEGFLVAFLAGMNSNPLRMAAFGLLIGEITDLTQQWVNAAFSNVIVFGILMLYVVYRSVVTRHPNWSVAPVLRLGRA
jgi:branched-subunit amino acid ABC-type transport system permease component